MDIIEVGGKVYGVVITQDDAGAEIGLWCGDLQVAAIVIDKEDASCKRILVTPLQLSLDADIAQTHYW